MDQNKIVEYQLLEQQLQQLNANLENIEQNIADINQIIKTLEDFKNLKKGDKILLPIANGIFTEGTLDNTNKLKINVGHKVVVDKTPADAIKMMQEQITELEVYKEETVKYYETMYMKMQTIQTELITAQEKENKK